MGCFNHQPKKNSDVFVDSSFQPPVQDVSRGQLAQFKTEFSTGYGCQKSCMFFQFHLWEKETFFSIIEDAQKKIRSDLMKMSFLKILESRDFPGEIYDILIHININISEQVKINQKSIQVSIANFQWPTVKMKYSKFVEEVCVLVLLNGFLQSDGHCKFPRQIQFAFSTSDPTGIWQDGVRLSCALHVRCGRESFQTCLRRLRSKSGLPCVIVWVVLVVFVCLRLESKKISNHI